jgi:hypothetical protein
MPFFEERNCLFSLISGWAEFSRVCDITSVPHLFPSGIRPSIRNCEEKIHNSREYLFQPKYNLFFIVIAYVKKFLHN